RDLLRALDRARLLHEIGRVLEVNAGKRAADFLVRAPRHDALGRAHHAGEADDADARRADFFEPLYHRLAVGAPRRTEIFHPILREAPPLDLVRAAHARGRLAFQREDCGAFRLESADLREVADVGAELVPMALVRQADHGVEIGLSHLRTHRRPAAVA